MLVYYYLLSNGDNIFKKMQPKFKQSGKLLLSIPWWMFVAEIVLLQSAEKNAYPTGTPMLPENVKHVHCMSTSGIITYAISLFAKLEFSS